MFEYIRSLMFPFKKIEKYLPQKGNILEVGCGHGTFSYLLAKSESERVILGIDPSKNKITEANKKPKLPNLEFGNKRLDKLNQKNFDFICIIDVLYLLTPKQKSKMIKDSFKRLKKGGSIMIAEVDISNPLFKVFIQIEEIIMTKILKITYTNNSSLQFRDNLYYKDLLRKELFKPYKNIFVKGILPYPHFLIFARK